MKKITIITIGNELLSGQRIDTNSAWLGSRLSEFGFAVTSRLAAADELDEICDCLKFAADKSDIILITGGLGPTDDDLTRQALAKFLNVELAFSQSLMDKMQEYFLSRGLQMASKNRIQAYLPAGAKALPNSCGTAPGISCNYKSLQIYAMPGVPSEMKTMFDNFILPNLTAKAEKLTTVCKKLKCVGIGESSLAEKIGDMMLRGQNPIVNCTVSNSIITLYIIASAPSKRQAEELADIAKTKLINLIGEYVYAEGEKELSEVIGEILRSKSQKLSTAESCTGGLIAKMITDIPGSSDFFEYGWVTYADTAKQSQLAVMPQSLQSFGAVSEQVVKEMAIGALTKSGSDYAIAVSGIAGPSGGTPEKPVGLVYIAVADKNKCIVEKRNYPSGRDTFRIRTATAALDLLRREILLGN